MNLAPIAISVYTRVNHFKQCIEALQKNTLAEESELYIYSDAASRDDDEKLVQEVRDYSHNIKGFKKVRVIERKKNYGGTQNAPKAHREITKKYGKSIFLEDDIVTAPGFLQFVNDALELYKDDEKILAVGGHTPNILENLYSNKDIYFTKRFSGWGLGTWEEKFNKIKPVSMYDISRNNSLKDKLDECGTDLYGMALLDAKGKINAGDVRACCLMAQENLYIVLPTKTLVKNIGLDGSGVHCGNENKYINDELSKKERFNFEGYYCNEKINQELKRFYDKPILIKRIINRIIKIIK
jgi:GT2 family glycosyltransferase